MEQNKLRKAQAFHNIGVVMQTHRQYGEAIEAYKEALRNNPTDNETRYNLVLCKKQQQQEQQDQNKQNSNQDKKQNPNKDKNKDQNKDQDQNKDNQDKQDREPQPQQQQMSQENAERLLDAAIQEEKRTQDKLQKAMQQPRRKSLQKNW